MSLKNYVSVAHAHPMCIRGTKADDSIIAPFARENGGKQHGTLQHAFSSARQNLGDLLPIEWRHLGEAVNLLAFATSHRFALPPTGRSCPIRLNDVTSSSTGIHRALEL